MSGYISSQYDQARDYIKKQDEQIKVLKEALERVKEYSNGTDKIIDNIINKALKELEEMSNEDQ